MTHPQNQQTRSNKPLSAEFLARLTAIVGAENMITAGSRLKRNSQDAYWYSPVLKKQLADKSADVIVEPKTQDQLVQIIQATVHEQIPIVPRGAGTGNYGQSVPIHGGVLISTKRLNRIIELSPDYAKVEAGVILLDIETAARKIGSELRFFPSTLPTSTAAGFLAGGSAGPGSMNWGNVWTPGNILEVKIVTIESEPKTITLTDPAGMQAVIHNCGLTAIITEVTYALAPGQQWQQYVLAFDTFDGALAAGELIAKNKQIPTRLASVFDWPLPSFFKQLVKENACPHDKPLLFLHTTLEPQEVDALAQEKAGVVTWHNPVASRHKSNLELTDFAWNHTTLWAMKVDPAWTCLQDTFDPENYVEHLRQRKAKYGDDVIDHVEFTGAGGEPYPAGLTIVRYRSDAQLQAMIDYGESIGIQQYSPHTTVLDEPNTRWAYKHLLKAKQAWDPHNLLNPGHLLNSSSCNP